MLALTVPSPSQKTQRNTTPRVPACRGSAISFTSAQDTSAAAEVCQQCCLVDDCLLTALRIDSAHRRGDDPVELTGVFGGVWFDPDHHPRRVTAPPGVRCSRTLPTSRPSRRSS